ncbi:SDR family oxidoreductase [Mycobacterium sp.]|uniref:SDR family oxidoreductase n=1 Tax=Mycobacterium sp. TaxID=1785 RepID=UPI0025D5D626|nr:SDR family oxidoreductase [Mycobacterium sp.]
MTIASATGVHAPTRSTVTASDGIALAVYAYTDIDPHRPTVLAIHGYPDNHHLWDGVAEQLLEHHRGKYNVVAYDVRGAGDSDRPAARSDYRFAQLVSDIGTVIDSLDVGRVHLLAHDWGSIQSWAAVTDETVMGKVASFTSISGPHLTYAGKFLRSARTPRGLIDVTRQIFASGYIWFFLARGLPELLIRAGVGVKLVETFGRIGNSSTQSRPGDPVRSVGDYVNGLNLYRANMPGPLMSPASQLPHTTVPTQVLAPRMDLFVTPALQRYTGSIPLGSKVVPIEGGHWVVTARPDVIARLATEWIDRHVDGTTPATAGAVQSGPRDVRGKLALVTGAGAGIGRATALELAQHGADTVVIVDRDLAAAQDTAAAVRATGVDAEAYQADVSDEHAINTLAAQVHNDHGVVDILVNNAGIGMAGRFLETTSENWDNILGVNLRGVLNGSRAFAAQMVDRGQGGTIINVSSAAAFLPSKSMIAYGTTKAAVLAFSESLRADLADDGITVTAVCPGFVNTNIAKNTVYAGMSAEEQDSARHKADIIYRRRNFTPEATAKAIVKAVKSGSPVVPIAAESRVGYAMRRISPSLIRLLARYDLRP